MFANYLKEACIETIDEALAAVEAGADRVEFCSHLELDGLTPDYDQVKKLMSLSDVPIMVMIRPRGGDFEYNAAEIEQMKEEIMQFKNLGVKGVVFGILEGQCVNVETTRILAKLASPLEVCFHKAIDDVSDPMKAVEKLIKIPEITRILTSGQKPTAEGGKETLLRMMEAAGEMLSIMPAGKVTADNIDQLHEVLDAKEYHGRRIVNG